jgi:cyclase
VIPIRVIPCLSLKGLGLVKTVQFKNPKYIGDPRNAVKIFNEKEVDEIVILDITATLEKKLIQFSLIGEIVSEAFVPIGYGGGVKTLEDAQKLISQGVEKIIICSYALESPSFIRQLSSVLGSQSTVVCIDVKKNFWGKYEVCSHSGTKSFKTNPVDFAQEMEKQGAGEIIINSIDKDGTMTGYDINLIRLITEKVNIPVVALGGAGNVSHLKEAINNGGASAVAAGSCFIYHGKHKAVLINFPKRKEIINLQD